MDRSSSVIFALPGGHIFNPAAGNQQSSLFRGILS
jgi:hypothetical protein